MGRQAEGLAALNTRNKEIDAFLAGSGWAAARRTRVAGDASNRRYDRLTDRAGHTAILMDAPPETGEDVRSFVRLADHLRDAGLSTPEIYAQDASKGLLLIEDFGDRLFAREMASEPAQQIPLYRAAVDVLARLRSVPKLDLEVCSAPWLVEMMAPVFEWYSQIDPDGGAQAFTKAFEPFAEEVARTETVLMLRDYHAENLLLLPERAGVSRVGILDFQDAMLAHPAYDLVSVLQDARRDVTPQIENEIMRYYLDQNSDDPPTFRRAYAAIGLQRNLRIIGIFARLGLRDGKASYIDMIPRVWGYVQRNLTHPDLSALATHLDHVLPEPTSDYLQFLRDQCPVQPTHS